MTNGRIVSRIFLFSRLEEMLETSEVMMGNDPMAKNMQQMLKGVQKLEINRKWCYFLGFQELDKAF